MGDELFPGNFDEVVQVCSLCTEVECFVHAFLVVQDLGSKVSHSSYSSSELVGDISFMIPCPALMTEELWFRSKFCEILEFCDFLDTCDF